MKQGAWEKTISLAGLLLAAGCGITPSKPVAIEKPLPDIAEPASLGPTELAILDGQSRIRVGDSQEDVERAIPAPPNSFPFKELPRQFNGQYRAKGFETGQMGFGAIYHENRLAGGVYRQENVTAGEVQSIVRAYISAFRDADQTLPSGSIQYWFWRREDQRLMICSVPDRQQPLRYDVTIGLGHEVVMDALRMSYPAAREDQSIGERNRSANPSPAL